MKRYLNLIVFLVIAQSLSAMHPAYLNMAWREEYEKKLEQQKLEEQKQSGQKSLIEKRPCVFCRLRDDTIENDTNNLVTHRFEHTYLALAFQPYIEHGIHLMIIPKEHINDLSGLSHETYQEINGLTLALERAFLPDTHELNIGLNLGTQSGGSINHFHKHFVFDGDGRKRIVSSFMKKTQKPDLSKMFEKVKKGLRNYTASQVTLPTVMPIRQKGCISCLQANGYFTLLVKKYNYHTVFHAEQPQGFGHLTIIPKKHITKVNEYSSEAYEELNHITSQLYSILKKLTNAPGMHVGMNISGGKNKQPCHLRRELIPRQYRELPFIVTIGKKVPMLRSLPDFIDQIKKELEE